MLGTVWRGTYYSHRGISSSRVVLRSSRQPGRLRDDRSTRRQAERNRQPPRCRQHLGDHVYRLCRSPAGAKGLHRLDEYLCTVSAAQQFNAAFRCKNIIAASHTGYANGYDWQRSALTWGLSPLLSLTRGVSL